MNTEIVEFNFNSSPVRAQTINNEAYFCLADACEALGLSNSRKTKTQLNEKGVTKSYILTNGGKQEITFINEPNLYRLIFRSNKPQAQMFADWVYEEVLPAIRRTGCYRAEREVLCEEFKQIIKEICGESLRNAWLDMLNSTDKDRQQSVFNQIALMFDMTVQAQVRKECEKRIEKMREIIYLPAE